MLKTNYQSQGSTSYDKITPSRGKPENGKISSFRDKSRSFTSNGNGVTNSEKADVQRSRSYSSGEDLFFEIDELPDHDHFDGAPSGESSILNASFNFVNSILGAGLIGLPYAIKESGLLFGIVSMIIVILLTHLSVVTLISSGVELKEHGYEGVMKRCFGSVGYFGILFTMSFQGFGAMCTYLIIIGDTLTPVFNLILGLNWPRQIYILISGILMILPLSLVRNMGSLGWTSLTSLIADIIIVLVVLIKSASSQKAVLALAAQSEAEDDYKIVWVRSTVFSGIGTMAFAFVCQHSTFIVFNTMRTPSVANWKQVSGISVSVSGLLGMALGVAGYITFLESTEANVLNCFDILIADSFIYLSRIMLALTMILTYPMENFVVRHCISDILKGVLDMQSTEKVEEDLHYTITLCIWASALVIGLTVTNLGLVFELIGAIGGVSLGFIFPAMIFFRVPALVKDKNDHEDVVLKGIRSKRPLGFISGASKRLYASHVFMLVFGLAVMVIGAFQAVTKHDSL